MNFSGGQVYEILEHYTKESMIRSLKNDICLDYFKLWVIIINPSMPLLKQRVCLVRAAKNILRNVKSFSQMLD